MARLRDTIDRTPEYVNFIQELKQFHAAKGTTLQAEPVLGGRRLDLYKIFQVVVNSGGFDEVTKNRGWKQVGDIFQFPSTCTNSAYILKGVYIRNLLGWEEEKLWSKDWVPPKELLGPHAHKSSTLAGKAYKTGIKKSASSVKSASGNSTSPKASKSTSASINNTNAATAAAAAAAASAASAAAAAAAAALLTPLTASLQQQLGNPLLYDFANNINLDPTVIPMSQSPVKTATIPPPMQLLTEPKLQVSESQDTTFNEKDRILFALQFGQRSDVEWALDEIVTMSFECPERLELNESPFLLQMLVSLAQPCLASHAADNALPTSASDTLSIMLQDDLESSPMSTTTECADFSINESKCNDAMNNNNNSDTSAYTDLGTLNIILKVLHILRNFSFLSAYIPTLSEHALVKEILVQALQTSMSTGHVELGRHSMDVLENIAVHLRLESAQDPCLNCIYQVVASHDRYLVIGSIRTLTWLTINKENQASVESSPVMERISQMLLSDDEELVGTALEYIYQHTRVSVQCRTQFLTSPYSNAYIGLLISLLMTKSKYFCTRFIQEDTALPTPLPAATTSTPSQPPQSQSVVPRVPDLTLYQKLDEPFRCLGWLKDKFEVADRTSVLSLDDVYLLYEARFGLEKALKMRDFYTVMKIAFPKASTSETSSLLGKSGKSAPVVEGLNIVGIQIKMSILQDRQQVPCKWDQCSLMFDDTFTLQRHVLHDHMTPTANASYVCSWSHCNTEQNLFENKDALISHLRTHFYNQIGESCCNSPVQSPAPSLSSSPSTPTSNISSACSMSTTSPTIKTMNIVVDDSEIQGIALVASHLLNWLSKDPQSTFYFIPYEKELTSVAEQRPKIASHIWSICSNFKSSLTKSTAVDIEPAAGTNYAACSS
ncbi:C2H2-type zinc finger transcription factor [Mucor lusitanicus]|uniref:C2H2-type zinc finger transcription factor n=2 Tax=Mucor circinelloides f. lusitanicus TaxID=29924 RepID=A0A168I2W7_MUCCL|nr:C2H2-type zinc finger transcription factor [Mucor lusitanicus]OAC99487.1 C2H2-type zinc finger transcription factor [Mucor lusitanicus CBS 277.49]